MRQKANNEFDTTPLSLAKTITHKYEIAMETCENMEQIDR